jgi:hypothetical protein
MVVLHELVRDAKVAENVPAIALEEEPSLVPMNDRADEHRTLEPCLESLHVTDPKRADNVNVIAEPPISSGALER